jgi:hypothetical protein
MRDAPHRGSGEAGVFFASVCVADRIGNPHEIHKFVELESQGLRKEENARRPTGPNLALASLS